MFRITKETLTNPNRREMLAAMGAVATNPQVSAAQIAPAATQAIVATAANYFGFGEALALGKHLYNGQRSAQGWQFVLNNPGWLQSPWKTTEDLLTMASPEAVANREFAYLASNLREWCDTASNSNLLKWQAYQQAGATSEFFERLSSADKLSVMQRLESSQKKLVGCNSDRARISLHGGPIPIPDFLHMRNVAGFMLSMIRDGKVLAANDGFISYRGHEDPQNLRYLDHEIYMYYACGQDKPSGLEVYKNEMAGKLRYAAQEMLRKGNFISKQTFDELRLDEYLGDRYPEFRSHDAFKKKCVENHHTKYERGEPQSLADALQQPDVFVQRIKRGQEKQGDICYGLNQSHHILATEPYTNLMDVVDALKRYLGETPLNIDQLKDDFSITISDDLREIHVVDAPKSLERALNSAILKKHYTSCMPGRPI